jgi:hypothetical protein
VQLNEVLHSGFSVADVVHVGFLICDMQEGLRLKSSGNSTRLFVLLFLAALNRSAHAASVAANAAVALFAAVKL